MKVFSYTVVHADDIMELVGEVRDHIKTGWEPTGGVIVLDRQSGHAGVRNFEYFQAMVVLEPQAN